jgi:hypothetical protein
VLSYSGAIENDGVNGAAFFDGMPMPATVSYSFQAVFDPASPVVLTSGIPLGPGQAAFVASSVSFFITGYGNFAVVPGSYYVTLQDPTGGGLFGNFVGTYAAGLDETIDPGAGAFLTGFTSATPDFTIASPAATIFAGDRGAIAEMYTPFTTGDQFAFFIPLPIPGAGSASVTVPEPSGVSVLCAGLLAWISWRCPLALANAGRRQERQV